MLAEQAVIVDFTVAPTRYVSPQTLFFEWLVDAHAQAETTQRGPGKWSPEAEENFRKELGQRLWHVGCKPEIIGQRGHILGDFLHRNWHEMQVYRLVDNPTGLSAQQRQKLHQENVEAFFEQLYQHEDHPPTDMIHVCCTGYASPSGAQRIISRKRWEGRSTVTHVYHMGCYGALPAIRIGQAFTHSRASRVDIVHTELCGLHMDPLNHSASQLVSQSLFADGCIKYSVVSETQALASQKPFLRILGMHEHVIPESTQYMQWVIGDAGFHFVLTKEIPVLISRALHEYVAMLFQKAGFKLTQELMAQMVFAVHPGGPKILDYVQKGFEIQNAQLQASRDILKKHGNMSSATLPHIWQAILHDEKIKSGTKILSMAFGPGLTIAGALLEKIG